jgi:hypothetical protein
MSDMTIKPKAEFPAELFTNPNYLLAKMREGVRLALIDHKRNGNPIVGYENGQIVWTEAKDIVIPDEETITCETK